MSPRWGLGVFVYPYAIHISPRWGLGVGQDAPPTGLECGIGIGKSLLQEI